VTGAQSTYFFRIRSRSTNIENSGAGLTSGSYAVQIRLREAQEFPGSTVQFANIRYATNGVHTTGLPSHSPLTGEANIGMYDGTPNDGITQVGSLHLTDRGAISVAGLLTPFAPNIIQFTLGDTDLVRPGFNTLYPITVDVDYADGLNRPDATAYLFSSQGLFVGSDSNIVDDRSGPLRGSDLADLSRGSVGTRDPFIGALSLPRGTYDLGITSGGSLPTAIARNTVLFDDSFEALPYRSIQTPAFGSFIPAVNTNLPAAGVTFSSGPVLVPDGGHGGMVAFGAQMAANNGLLEQVRSVPFTVPTTWDANDPIRFSLNYRVTPGVGLTVRLYDNPANAGTPAAAIRTFVLNSNNAG